MPSGVVSSVRDANISNDCGTAGAAFEDTKRLPGILKFSILTYCYILRQMGAKTNG